MNARLCEDRPSPHLPQKRESPGIGELHLGQRSERLTSPRETIAKEPLPHRPQKRTPSAKRDPQFWHVTTPGMMLDGPEAAPCDGDVYLETSRA